MAERKYSFMDSLNLALDGGLLHFPAVLPPEKYPAVPTEYDAGLTPEPI